MTKARSYQFKISRDRKIPFIIDNEVFFPTGTTDVLFGAVNSYIQKPGKTLDLGCGSGVIGIALFQNGLIEPPVYSSDLSSRAVSCAEKNASFHHCPIIAKKGSLFNPWQNEKFDYIVSDVAGISEKVAEISPWYNDVPCSSGIDGTLLVDEILKDASDHLNAGGLFFFPVISFSNTAKILETAQKNFLHVERLIHKEWPLPEEMGQHVLILKELRKNEHIDFMEKFGLIIWFTDIYVAHNM